MRKFLVNLLYNLAKAICLAADKLSPKDDSVWRGIQWDRYNEADDLAEAEAETEVAEPALLGDLLQWPAENQWPKPRKPCDSVGPTSGYPCVKKAGHEGTHRADVGSTWT